MVQSSAKVALSRRRNQGTAVALVLWAMLLAACRIGPGEAGERGAPDVGAPAPVADASPDVLPDAGPDLPPPIDLASDHVSPLGFPPEGHQRLRGYFVFGNELMAFQSCGLPALTWLDLQGGEKGWKKLQGVNDPLCPPAAVGRTCVSAIYVELDAIVSGPCQCGHVGKYGRALRVEELLAASATSPSDCPRTMPFFP